MSTIATTAAARLLASASITCRRAKGKERATRR